MTRYSGEQLGGWGFAEVPIYIRQCSAGADRSRVTVAASAAEQEANGLVVLQGLAWDLGSWGSGFRNRGNTWIHRQKKRKEKPRNVAVLYLGVANRYQQSQSPLAEAIFCETMLRLRQMATCDQAATALQP